METENVDTKSLMKIGIKAAQRHLRPFRLTIVLISFLGILSAVANASVPFVVGRLFDSLILLSQGVRDGGWPLWLTLLIVWTIVQVVANNVDWIIERMRRSGDLKIHLSLQVNSFIQLLRVPISFHKDNKIQDVLERVGRSGWRLSAIFRTVVELAPQLLSLLVGLVISIMISFKLAMVMVGCVLIYIIILYFTIRPAAKYDEVGHKLWNESWDNAASAVTQVQTVKQASAEDYESEKIEDNYHNKSYKAWMKVENIWSNVGYFQRLLVLLTQLAIYILSIKYVAEGTITIGELLALNGYSAMFFGPFVRLGYSWQTIQNGLISIGNLESVFETNTEKYHPEGSINRVLSGNIEFHGVNFTYSDRQTETLHDLNIKINAGEIIALVGESGSGKSTTISLVSGYYFASEGEVIIDGVNIKNWDLNNLRSQIAVVPQEIELFNDTLKNNIKYGNFNATDNEINDAVRGAHLEEFIASLPLGLETLVGERGMKLSVGQKQRVSIARAFLRNPKILILDEPTSALDAMTEKHISESLEKLMEGRTTFIIAHRLSTVHKSDRIFVFDRGHIVEEGNHFELLKNKDGIYKKLHDYQIGLH